MVEEVKSMWSSQLLGMTLGTRGSVSTADVPRARTISSGIAQKTVRRLSGGIDALA